MANHQLFALTRDNYRLPFAIDSKGSVITSRADSIPCVSWPDGRWSFEANLYMLELYERGLSRKNGGGSLKTYAANISHLIRYCFYNKTDFIQLTDAQFTLFMKGLQVERKNKNPNIKIRDANTSINIGRNCLDFLDCVGRFHHQPNFVSQEGRIKAEKKDIQINIQGRNKSLHRSYWQHHSFSHPDPKVRVLPISSDNIKKLQEAINQVSHSYFLKRRRQTMLMMLEMTGGRRGEIANLTVNSVIKAKQTKEPMLELITLKRRGLHKREIPISSPDLDGLIHFIEKHRHHLVRKKIGLNCDHGFVFVSETTGKPLNAQTISQEIYLLAKAARIDEKAHAHMFRHRFITKLFIALIQQHELQNKDDFRRALMDVEVMKQKIQQWTGHTNTDSLDIYINLAFEELTHFKKTYDAINLSRVVDSVRNQLAIIRSDLNMEPLHIDSIKKIEKLVDSFERSLHSR